MIYVQSSMHNIIYIDTQICAACISHTFQSVMHLLCVCIYVSVCQLRLCFVCLFDSV